jgi:hypothetical protein
VHRRDNKYVTNFSRRPKRKKPLGRLGHTCEDNQEIDLKNQCGKMWDGQISFRIEPSAGLL